MEDQHQASSGTPVAGGAVRPTKKQRALLDFIQAFIQQHGYSPSYREIMNGCGYNSIATVAVHINNLIARGHLRKRDHSARSLEITGLESAPAGFAKAGQTPEAAWVLAKLDALLRQVESPAAPLAELDRQHVLADVRRLTAALPVLEVDLPDSLAARLQAIALD